MMLVAGVSATCAPPSAVNAAAYMKYSVQEMKDEIVTAKQTQATDKLDAGDAKTILDACHTTNHAKTPVEISTADGAECLQQKTDTITKDAASSKSDCLVTEYESVLVKLEAIAKKDAEEKVQLAMTAYATSPKGTTKLVCIQFVGEEILNDGVFAVLKTDLMRRDMYLEHGSCGEQGYTVQVTDYKEKLENIDITAWDETPIA